MQTLLSGVLRRRRFILLLEMLGLNRRLSLLFFGFVFGAFCLMANTLRITLTPQYVAAASNQSVYNVTVCRTRGRIYDCKLRSLAGGRLQYRAVIAPSRETTVRLMGILPQEKLAEIQSALTGNHPFVCDVDNAEADGNGVIVFPAQKRYSVNCIAVHTVGYVGSDGQGVYGIERAYNDYLSEAEGQLSARFTVDATGSGLAGIEPEITDTTDRSLAGVVLTIDADIQAIAEEAAEKYIEKGAIVVMDVQTGALKAVVSVPDFEQNDIAAALDAENSPLLNRAISAYDLGSVFKLVVTASALESGIDSDLTYCCTGCVTIGNNQFHCANRNGHGELNMEQAFAKSCNTYFIQLARLLGGEVILEYAYRFGFGQKIMLANDYFTSAGCLPSEETLALPAALANFSFGQGELMASPVHVAAMTAAVANGGIYMKPTVVDRLVNSELEAVSVNEAGEGIRVLSESAADTLLGFMKAAVEYGTAKAGAAENVSCAAKTGTAETGIYLNGSRVMQAWYAGCFGAEEPEYVVTVLVEGGESGGGSAGPVFRYIAERLK